ncbi:hypothetical protein [Corynebacterium minutissimum]|uniref:hypothetical protein n=1 Tax=Corynebacterium minutissimum TaxID=38301 RepID=UPI001EF34E17|nr:hypothetical protein [Corynebacterium minutissimum]MCG7239585.1 hypothetical protein [Corynebacterium minutissimum]
MSRWRVYKDESEFEWAPWHATDGRYLYRTQSFADALAHADRRARTVQVALPRVAPHPDYGYLVDPDDPWVYSWGGRWHLAPIGDWDSHAALLCNDVGEYKIHASELKPLALALLAADKYQENQ